MQSRQKQERIIEAVRKGLEGDAAVEFVCQSGYAMSIPAIAKNLRLMGGRKNVEQLIAEGKSNVEVLRVVFPDDGPAALPLAPPTQRELFEGAAILPAEPELGPDLPLYETTKLTLRVPTDLFEAIRIAAKAEQKPQNQLIVDILTSALSRMP